MIVMTTNRCDISHGINILRQKWSKASSVCEENSTNRPSSHITQHKMLGAVIQCTFLLHSVSCSEPKYGLRSAHTVSLAALQPLGLFYFSISFFLLCIKVDQGFRTKTQFWEVITAATLGIL